MTPYTKHVYGVSTYIITFRLGYLNTLITAPQSLRSPPPTSSYTLELHPPVGAMFQFVLSEESNRRIENHNFSFEFEKYIFCVLGQKFQRENMKLQLLTCGLVFGQKVQPTFSPDQSVRRYISIRNQYKGLFSITSQFDLI